MRKSSGTAMYNIFSGLLIYYAERDAYVARTLIKAKDNEN